MYPAMSKQEVQDEARRRPKTPTRMDLRPIRDVNPVTKRAFLIDVVVPDGADLRAEPWRDLIHALGPPVKDPTRMDARSLTPASSVHGRSTGDIAGSQQVADRSKLEALVKEFVDTERRYLQRITALKGSYADPLRHFAKRPDTMIIPLYDARTIFSNLDAIVEASASFLADIAQIDLSGRVRANGVGDICLRHLKDLGTFACYKAYLDKQDESQRALQAMLKKPAFATFVESVKYQTTGISNVGIRELLMEPVQRIPRYTLLWQSMVKVMSPRDPQSAKLQEAISLASNIAHCQTDERTRRATIMFCLERTIEGFPVNLISNKRDFIDIIDVEDFPPERLLHRGSVANLSPSKRAETPFASPERGSTSGSLPCTLVLLSDKLLILKRQHSSVSGPETTGLHNIDALMSSGGGLAGLSKVVNLRKDKLGFKGCVDITETIAADIVDSGDLHFFLERPPTDQGERWSGRPFRHFAVLPGTVAGDKGRFLTNLWRAQALVRSRARAATESIIALCDEGSLTSDPDNERNSACTYWNVWTESAWLREASKAKLVLGIGLSNKLDLGPGDDTPHVVTSANIIPYNALRVSTISKDEDRASRADTNLDVQAVPRHLSETAHLFGLFRFRPSTSMAPLTPTHSYRMRPKMVNLDSISRNLFGAGSMSARSDSVSTSRRSKSVTSRYSTNDEFCFSTDTASTRASSLFGDSLSGCVDGKPAQLGVLSSVPEAGSLQESAVDGESVHADRTVASERDLDLQLSIARANSIDAATAMSRTRSEGLPQDRQRGALRIVNGTPSPDAPSRGATATVDKTLPSFASTEPLRIVRSRSASPEKVLNRTPTWSTKINARSDTPAAEDDIAGKALASLEQTPLGAMETLLPKKIGSGHTKLRVVSGRGRRVSANRETTPLRLDTRPPEPAAMAAHKRARSEEADFPRKRSYDSQSMPAGLLDIAAADQRHSSVVGDRDPLTLGVGVLDGAATSSESPSERSVGLLNATQGREDQLDLAVHSTARLRAAFDVLSAQSAQNLARQQNRRRVEGPDGPSIPRSPPSRRLSRLDHTGTLDLSAPHTPQRQRETRPELDYTFLQDWSQSALLALGDIESHIAQAQDQRDGSARRILELQQGSERMAADLLSKQNRLDRASARYALAQSQIAELQKEVDAVYEAFNTELDGVFADVGRPASEAEVSLRRNLQLTKAERNEVQLENLRLRRELQEANLKKAEWAQILKSRGIIP